MKTIRQIIQCIALAIIVFSGLESGRAADNATILPDVVYGHKHGLAMTFDVYQPQAASGAGVLFMVSGGWFSGWAPPDSGNALFKSMLDAGLTVFGVRHGSSPKFNIPEIVEDVRRSVRFIRQNARRFGVDPERLGVCGGSAGGHLSLVLGTTSDPGDPNAKDEVLRFSDRVAAVVAYFPPTDLRPWVTSESKYYHNYPALQFDAARVGDYSPLLQVSQDDPPTLLIHGDKDELVPIDHSQKILAAFKEKGVKSRLLVIEGAAHGFRGEDSKRAHDALTQWFRENLAK